MKRIIAWKKYVNDEIYDFKNIIWCFMFPGKGPPREQYSRPNFFCSANFSPFEAQS